MQRGEYFGGRYFGILLADHSILNVERKMLGPERHIPARDTEFQILKV